MTPHPKRWNQWKGILWEKLGLMEFRKDFENMKCSIKIFVSKKSNHLFFAFVKSVLFEHWLISLRSTSCIMAFCYFFTIFIRHGSSYEGWFIEIANGEIWMQFNELKFKMCFVICLETFNILNCFILRFSFLNFKHLVGPHKNEQKVGENLFTLFLIKSGRARGKTSELN